MRVAILSHRSVDTRYLSRDMGVGEVGTTILQVAQAGRIRVVTAEQMAGTVQVSLLILTGEEDMEVV